jgi:hypothetical protein
MSLDKKIKDDQTRAILKGMVVFNVITTVVMLVLLIIYWRST